MDKLLNPDVGLVITTIVTFLLLLAVLSKFAWKPIIEGLSSREKKIRDDLSRAEESQKKAEVLRVQYETQLAEAQKSIQEMVSQAKADGEKTKTQIINDARAESARIIEKGQKELINQTAQLKIELKQEVAGLSVSIAEKILNRAVDKNTQETVLKEAMSKMGEAV